MYGSVSEEKREQERNTILEFSLSAQPTDQEVSLILWCISASIQNGLETKRRNHRLQLRDRYRCREACLRIWTHIQLILMFMSSNLPLMINIRSAKCCLPSGPGLVLHFRCEKQLLQSFFVAFMTATSNTSSSSPVVAVTSCYWYVFGDTEIETSGIKARHCLHHLRELLSSKSSLSLSIEAQVISKSKLQFSSREESL